MEDRLTSKRNLCGPRLREIRRAKDLSQAQLAVKCQLQGWDIDRKLVSKIETKRRQVTDLEIVVLASVLGVKPEEIVAGLSAAEATMCLQSQSRTG